MNLGLVSQAIGVSADRNAEWSDSRTDEVAGYRNSRGWRVQRAAPGEHSRAKL